MAITVYPTSQQQRVEAYLHIMEEIKNRFQLIEITRASTLPFGLAREVCILQLRHIAELIAIGCLAAQGKLTGSRAILSEDNPTKIFREIDKTWRHSFPQAVTLIPVGGGGVNIDANSKPNALTRAEAEKMWANSGHYLHRLTVKKFFTVEEPEKDPWAYVDTQVSKIRDLLATHLIAIPNPERVFLVAMFGRNGKPHAELINLDLATRKASVSRFSIGSSGRSGP
jgi:hypothetical protein